VIQEIWIAYRELNVTFDSKETVLELSIEVLNNI